MSKVRLTYEQIIEIHPEFKGIVTQESWDFMKDSDERTVKVLEEQWARNIKINVHKKLWKKYGPVQKDCFGLGKNKAVIGVGAGSSLKKNIDVLKHIHDEDGVKSWADREFLILASNHMYKPLLEKGIIPDFVLLTDASDVVRDQLLKDVPSYGKNSILISGIHCDPRVLRDWVGQGREVRFYVTTNDKLSIAFRESTGIPAYPFQILQGGNVLNLAWSLSAMVFQSWVFIAVGNDLSYPLHDDMDKQRKGYYADGDYSSNAPKTGTGRDEAKSKKRWLGFIINKSNVLKLDGKTGYNFELEPVGTTHTLWVYKTWLEANVVGSATKNNPKLWYYNATEGGIAGVMCKDHSDEGLNKEDNWYMLDDICKRYRTRTLVDAVNEFREARKMVCQKKNAGIHTGVQGVGAWALGN